MNQEIIDNTLLATSLICSIVVTKSMRKRKADLMFSTLLLFPPLLIFLNMWAHTIAVSVLNARRLLANSFEFNFTVYSHYLFGISFIFLSGFTIHFTKKYLSGYTGKKKNILLLNCLTFVLFLPVGFINPIGFLPVIAVIFSSVLISVHNPYRKTRKINDQENNGIAKQTVQISR